MHILDSATQLTLSYSFEDLDSLKDVSSEESIVILTAHVFTNLSYTNTDGVRVERAREGRWGEWGGIQESGMR